MSYKYDPYRNTLTHINDENPIASLPIPASDTSVIVKQYELTNDCIERIADAVVRKLKEVEHETN